MSLSSFDMLCYEIFTFIDGLKTNLTIDPIGHVYNHHPIVSLNGPLPFCIVTFANVSFYLCCNKHEYESYIIMFPCDDYECLKMKKDVTGMMYSKEWSKRFIFCNVCFSDLHIVKISETEVQAKDLTFGQIHLLDDATKAYVVESLRERSVNTAVKMSRNVLIRRELKKRLNFFFKLRNSKSCF